MTAKNSTDIHFRDSPRLRSVVIFTRLLFGVGVVLVVVGGSLEGQYKNSNLSSIGMKLVKAGYIIVLVIFFLLIGFETYFWGNLKDLADGGRSVRH